VFSRQGKRVYVIGTAGHVDHGKSALVQALSGINPDRWAEERARGLTIDLGFAWCELPSGRAVSIVDVPGHERFIKNMLAGVGGINLALLVIAADEGVMPQTREHVLLAKQVGVPKIIVFLNKCDMVDDEEMIMLVEEELRELLSAQGFDGENAPIIKGSGLKALEEPDGEWGEKVVELANAMDEYFPLPKRDLDKPFLMPVEDIFSIEGRGTVVTGRVERGSVKVGEEIEIVGIKDTTKTTVTGVEMFNKQLDAAQAGDNAGILLRGTKKEDVHRGQVLSAPGSVTPHTEFEAEVYVLSKDEGGRHTPFFSGYKPQFYIRTTDVTGEVTLADGVEMVMPGDTATFKVKLVAPVALEEQTNFAIREGGKTVGAGVVTKIVT